MYIPEGIEPTLRAVVDTGRSCPLRCRMCFINSDGIVPPIVYTKVRKKRMNRIQVGEEILTVDERTGQLVWTTVKSIISNEVIAFFKLKTKSGKKFYVTGEHPFYVSHLGWVKAQDLKVGDDLLYIRKKEASSFANSARMKVNNPMFIFENIQKMKDTSDYVALGLKIKERIRIKKELGTFVGGFTRMRDENPEKFEELSKNASIRMKKNNPMKDQQVIDKGLLTKRQNEKYENYQWKLNDWRRKLYSDRMKENNPMFNEEIKMRAITSRSSSPSKPELWFKALIEENNFPIVYVGDAKLWVTSNGKHINPDFRIIGEKKVIEIYESCFWRRGDSGWAEQRKQLFTDIGWECLCLDVKDRKEKKEELSFLVRDFISNGDEIISIKRVDANNTYIGHGKHAKRPKNIPFKTINFSCAPYDTFLANNILVHNCYHKHSDYKGFKSFGQIKKEVDDAFLRGCNWIDFTGGEPTLLPHLPKVIDYVHSINMKCCIISCGVINPERLERIIDTQPDGWLFSLHGGYNYTHDAITGMKDSFFRLIDTMDEVRHYSDIRINTVITKYNQEELYDIAKLARAYKAKIVNFLNFNPHYGWRNDLNSIDFIADLDVVETELHVAIDYLWQEEIGVNVRYYPMCKIAEEFRCTVCNPIHVLFDPMEWDYSYMPKTKEYYTQKSIEMNTAVSKVDGNCAVCDLQKICGGINKYFDQATNSMFTKPIENCQVNKEDFYHYRRSNLLVF
jgi:MoaA/NifB/PqqE/SkfB family radical SAM enzyme